MRVWVRGNGEVEAGKVERWNREGRAKKWEQVSRNGDVGTEKGKMGIASGEG